MDEVALARLHLDLDDMAGDLGGERYRAGGVGRRIFRHEQAATREGPADRAQESGGAGRVGGGAQLDATGHPAQLARLGDQSFAGVESDFEDRERVTENMRAHNDQAPSRQSGPYGRC
jgi:hypothetical protein